MKLYGSRTRLHIAIYLFTILSSMDTSLLSVWKSCVYFPHQVEGIHWMLQKETEGTFVTDHEGNHGSIIYGGLQCDDMGVGKTIQTVATIVNNPRHATLILAPLAMIESWSSVCTKAGVCVFELDKGTWNCINSTSKPPRHFRHMRPNVYITNYDKLIHNKLAFKKPWDRIVLDEAHKIRNPTGQFARLVREIQAEICWAVTGTPLVNSYKDVASLLAFIGVPHTPSFGWNSYYMDLLPELLIHRSLDSLRDQIQNAPPVPIIIEEVLPFLTDNEKDFYKGIQCTEPNMKYAQDIMTSVQSFQLLLRLRQLSVHPQIYINAKRREDSTYTRDDWTLPTTKFNFIVNTIMKDDNARRHKYIIFCQFMEEMELLKTELETFVPNVLLYHGGMSHKERNNVLEYSKETPYTTVLLLQLQAGGVGLNLQEYDRIIFVSPWWTSALMDQAIARAVRMGQKEVVKVYHLRLTEESDEKIINIDTTIQKKASEKRDMLEKIFSY